MSSRISDWSKSKNTVWVSAARSASGSSRPHDRGVGRDDAPRGDRGVGQGDRVRRDHRVGLDGRQRQRGHHAQLARAEGGIAVVRRAEREHAGPHEPEVRLRPGVHVEAVVLREQADLAVGSDSEMDAGAAEDASCRSVLVEVEVAARREEPGTPAQGHADLCCVAHRQVGGAHGVRGQVGAVLLVAHVPVQPRVGIPQAVGLEVVGVIGTERG